MLRIVGIHKIEDISRWPRNRIHELEKLLEKRTRKIVVTAVGHRIPFIRPPVVMLVHFQSGIRRNPRKNLLPARRIFHAIEIPLIPKNKPPDEPALRTPRWRRDLYFVIENEILRFDDELGFTILTMAGLP